MSRERGSVAIVGVVGAGVMGAGIAQVALEAGAEVVLHDVDPTAVDRATARIRDGLGRRASKLDLDADSIDEWVDGRLGRLRHSETLDGIAAEAELIIEAVAEDPALKSAVFRTLDAEAGPDVILATNTSALSVRAIAEATSSPERVLGLHFFNPVPLMALVEVVVPELADPDVVKRSVATVAAWGKTTVRCTDSPGFIVNRVNRPFTLEALAILASGIASPGEIDAAIRDAGFPLGPFELMDLTGIDVTTAATRSIHRATAEAGDPYADRFLPSPIQERLLADGHLGRKTGHGFYTYDAAGRRATPAAADGGPSAGEVVDRITIAVVGEAYRALGDEVASADDIDLAMRLGVGHPMGPFERVASLGGPRAVVAALERRRDLGPRFVPPMGLLAAAAMLPADRPAASRGS